MKDKILVFIIGLLVGAIIATCGFLIYERVNKNNNDNQMPNFEKMQMRERPDGEEPPTKPEGMQQNGEEPPQMSDGTGQDETKKEKKSKDKSSTDSNNTTNENSTV